MELREEIFWKQKSRNAWLEEGDWNTRFFDALVADRIRKEEIKSILSFPDNEALLASPSLQEVHQAINSLPKDGALGPDEFFGVAAPSSFSDFRPIILYNCIYKIFSKIIASSLNNLLPLLISPKQGAFVKGRSIVENIALAQEMFVDINRKLVFNLINGEVARFFKSFRGLRQGDPLSPSPFILAAKVLSRGFKSLMERGECLPYKLKQGCPIVSHLLFADDTLLFLNGGTSSLRVVNKFLEDFQYASGQLINCGKSSFFFSEKVPITGIRLIEHKMGILKSTAGYTYLGVPIARGRVKRADF
ncbi:uncharacterized protein LOC131218135 [Magnolia sinica]|uniref:uncharacterized protein LOC131218135 n=1 Tax=Magnolia sinica TaxID=86752 RepID=UPI0026592266|nr:uncharacterized protein LOC131218135 [Magnolia sinica]